MANVSREKEVEGRKGRGGKRQNEVVIIIPGLRRSKGRRDRAVEEERARQSERELAKEKKSERKRKIKEEESGEAERL